MINELIMGSLFDGVAMLPFAAELNGIRAVWASEIEKFPIAVSKHHFPDMKHLGDICGIGLCTYITHFSGTKCNFYINTAKDILVKPVDIITFSSPCQDLSVAGKRAGLAGERSGLFSEAVRIIKEMRFVTDEMYPKYAIWENVPGAFSSNKGQDFRTVLEEITASEIPMPKSGKWANAGMVRGDGYSVAWRVCDAQYWGVAQRRKRIFLVCDFRGQRAGEILFECESVSGDFAESGEARQEVAGSAGNGIETTIRIFDIGDRRRVADESVGVTPTLTMKMGTGGNNVPVILKRDTIAFNGRQDPVYGQVTGALDTDRATQCIAYPEPANALLAKGNLSYRADVDNLVCAVDIRNLYETEELSETLQSKQTGGYSLNYQNPVRVPIGGINYGNADKTNAREILFALWREIGTEAFCKWAVRVVEYFQQKGILQPEMYGEGVREQTETEIGKLGNESFQIEKNCSTGSLRNMRKTECFRCTPQRRGLDKQRTRESSKDLSELSQLKAQAEKALRHLWGSSKGLWIMYKALTEIQEARRSDDRKDKSEEEMQSMRRTCSLERALWDALYESEKSREPVRYAVRRLLPLECERLQSMPDGWTDIPDASDTARYKAIGNSLVMNIADWIFSQIVKAEKGEL